MALGSPMLLTAALRLTGLQCRTGNRVSAMQQLVLLSFAVKQEVHTRFAQVQQPLVGHTTQAERKPQARRRRGAPAARTTSSARCPAVLVPQRSLTLTRQLVAHTIPILLQQTWRELRTEASQSSSASPQVERHTWPPVGPPLHMKGLGPSCCRPWRELLLQPLASAGGCCHPRWELLQLPSALAVGCCHPAPLQPSPSLQLAPVGPGHTAAGSQAVPS
mmetsp:Transcript_87243/g.241995  ORF Transcript_87243/g.241995 Transcript_87243/m.241995 type:complete len:219 (-) Transcript_87243:837-1493(-)